MNGSRQTGSRQTGSRQTVFSRFSPRLQQAIVARLGWSSLRPVQEEAGEALLAGRNAVVLAPTAGGKTEAAMFPLLSALIEEPAEGLGVIYVAPIKALLNNQSERLDLYTEMVGLRRFVWHGDTSSHQRRHFLKSPTELLMTTPESLEVMLISRRVDAGRLFADLRAVVVDEIHAVAGTDRGAHLMSVIERITQLSRHDVQRVGLSATVGNPEAILGWLQGISGRSGAVVDPPRPPARRQLLVVHRPEMPALASYAARMARGAKSLFFCETRATTEAVAEEMRRAGTTVFVHHSSVSREERELAEERFNHGSDACIVCTSTLELGIDVGDLDRVLQSEAPSTVSSFLQRMGRTGRREGQVANTTFFCESEHGVLQAAALVELAKQGWVEEVEVPDRCWPVLIHQLLAMSLAGAGVTVEESWSHLSRLPDFRGIQRAEFDRLIAWMLRDRSLLLASGRLVLGPKAERRFGRRNFMDLYAVFSSPQTYTVQTPSGQVLGSLSQGFVDRLVDGVSCFLLGGRAWVVLQVRHGDRRVVVDPAASGKQPSWGGFLPQFLGLQLCQKILEVLAGDEPFAYLDSQATEILDSQRANLRDALEGGRGGFEVDSDEIRWWTFAGGRINTTLRYAIEALGHPWKVIADNLLLRIRGEDLSWSEFNGEMQRLSGLEIWEDEDLWRKVAEGLPAYRLSKFQLLMPPWVEREVIASHLLDIGGTWQWLSGSIALDGSPLARIPIAVGQPTKRDPTAPPTPVVEEELGALRRDDARPVRWVGTDAEVVSACETLRAETVLGLDVETTLRTRTLCLIQIATPAATYLIDALKVADLEALGEIFRDPSITKVIHHAPFERSVLGRYGLELNGVVDTLTLSRKRHGFKAEGGHSLRTVCQRELGSPLDKSEQTSDWSRRPLAKNQVAYAALDAEVLLPLFERLKDPQHELPLGTNDREHP